MCERVYVRSTLAEMVRRFSFGDATGVDVLSNQFPRYNGAPRQVYPIIVMDEVAKGTSMFTSATWGLVPSWQKEPPGPGQRPPPINVKSETIATNGMFKRLYASKRCLIPIDGFFE